MLPNNINTANNQSLEQIQATYHAEKASSFVIAGRKVLHFLSFGKIAINPVLDESIKKIIVYLHAHPLNQEKMAEDHFNTIGILDEFKNLANSESASHESKLMLDHVKGALKAQTIKKEDIEEKISSEDFLTINNPYDPESFALGTFSLFPITVDEIKFTCVESAFQAQKFNNPEIKEKFQNLSGIEAQILAEELKKEVRSDWNTEAPKVMENLLSLRSGQNPDYLALLLASKDSYLVAHSKSSYWGDGNGKGENVLGKLIMNERENCLGTGIVAPTLQYLEHFKLPVESEFKVCTYNLGTSLNDYTQLFGADYFVDENARPMSRDDKEYDAFENDLTEVRRKLQNEAADLIFNTSKGDVFCLQEVASQNTPLLEILKERDFDIIRPIKKDGSIDTTSDTAIAINTKKFKDIKNQSFLVMGTADVSMASAIDKTTGKTVTFLSGHIQGFPLERLEDMKETAAGGDNEIKAILRKINTICTGSDIVVFGGDFNASPDTYNDRFEILTDAGYQHYSTGEATNLTTNPKFATNLKERKLDHFAVNARLDHQITMLKTPKEIALNPMSSSSDHLPIFMKVSYTAKENGIGLDNSI